MIRLQLRCINQQHVLAVAMQGTMLAISPYEVHTSPHIYGESAARFNPDRTLPPCASGTASTRDGSGVAVELLWDGSVFAARSDVSASRSIFLGFAEMCWRTYSASPCSSLQCMLVPFSEQTLAQPDDVPMMLMRCICM